MKLHTLPVVCISILTLFFLTGCNNEQAYEIVTERGLQKGWVLVLPAKIKKEAENWKGKVIYSDSKSGKEYTVPFTFRSKLKYQQYLALTVNKAKLPVQGTSYEKASADIEMRAGGVLGKNMSIKHPVWKVMEKRKIKQTDIIDADTLDIVIRDTTYPYHQLRQGRYPYLVPKQ